MSDVDVIFHPHPIEECDPKYYDCRQVLRIRALEAELVENIFLYEERHRKDEARAEAAESKEADVRRAWGVDVGKLEMLNARLAKAEELLARANYATDDSLVDEIIAFLSSDPAGRESGSPDTTGLARHDESAAAKTGGVKSRCDCLCHRLGMPQHSDDEICVCALDRDPDDERECRA